MNKIRRVTAYILSFVMVVSIFSGIPLNVYAADFEEPEMYSDIDESYESSDVYIETAEVGADWTTFEDESDITEEPIALSQSDETKGEKQAISLAPLTPRQKAIKAVLGQKSLYAELTTEEQKLLEAEYTLDLGAMASLEKKGRNIVDSLSYAQAVKRSGETLDTILKNYPKEEDCMGLVLELAFCDEFFVGNTGSSLAKNFKKHVLDGNSFSGVLTLYGISQATGLSLDSLFPGQWESFRYLKDIRYAAIRNYAIAQKINGDALVAYAKQKNLTLEQVKTLVESGPEFEIAPQQAARGGMSIMSSSPPKTTIPIQDDPKQYPDSPFRYRYQDSESVTLNSGSLNHSVTDLSLPGKNGFDVNLVRTYNSSNSNEQDINVQYNKIEKFSWKVTLTVKYKSYDDGKVYSDTQTEYSEQLYIDRYECIIDAENRRDDLLDYYSFGEDYDGMGTVRTRSAKATRQVLGKCDNYYTGTRPNDHFTKMFGLGIGWDFNMPSIETVGNIYKQDRMRYADYLHLEDGRSFKVLASPTSATDSNLQITENGTDKAYTLTDVRVQKLSGTIGSSSYDLVLFYKDGTKAYFLSKKLVAREDRFGNLIQYTIQDNGGMTIKDSVGRTLVLSKTAVTGGYVLKWTLPENKTLEYTVIGNRLTQFKDAQGRVTKYGYTNNSIFGQYGDYRFGDDGTNITYANLTNITHSTGAQSVFTYGTSTVKLSDLGGTRAINVLSSRYDMDKGSTSKLNQMSYSYTVSGKYISAATVNRGGVSTEAHTFTSGGLLTKLVATHGGKTASEKTVAYNTDKLPTSETLKTLNPSGQSVSSSQSWTYDKKGNVLTSTDPLSNRTTITYHATYNLPLTKVYNKDAATVITEENTLNADAKTVQWQRVYETVSNVKTPKQVTQYLYSGGNVIEAREYYGNLSSPSSYKSTLYSYANNNPSNPSGFNNAFVTQTKLTGVKDADGALAPSPYGDGVVQTAQKYDWYGRVIEAQGPADEEDVIQTTYDALGRVTSETYGDGSSKQSVYNDVANSITITDENGSSLKYVYTSLGNIGSVSNPDSGTQLYSYQYDLLGRLISSNTHGDDGSIKAKSQTTYDAYDRVTQEKTTDSGSTVLSQKTIVYDDALLKETATILGDSSSPNQIATTYKDKLGRVIKTGYQLSGSERQNTLTYDNIGNKLTERTALDASRGVSYTAKYEYDFAGRVTKATNALGQALTSEYDALGNKIRQTDYAGNATTYAYDILGRLLVQASPFEKEGGTLVTSKTTYEYDPAGRILTQTSDAGQASAGEQRVTENRYDLRGRLTDSILHEENQPMHTKYAYDNKGNTTAMYTGVTGDSVDGAAKTVYSYNSFDQVLSTTDPLGQTESYDYDNTGRLLSKKDRNGNTTSYAYDALDRITRQAVSGENIESEAITNTYTLTGLKKTEANPTLSISYQYDELGRLTKETENIGVVKNHSYDIGGNRTGFGLSKGTTLISNAYTYDNLNRMQQVKEGTSPLATYAYDTSGNRASLTYSNGVKTTYTYNAANLVTGLENKAGTEVVSSYAYTYNLDGNQASKTDHNGKETQYIYDQLGRLTEESEAGSSAMAYTFDAFGNRSSMQVSGEDSYAVRYTYDENNRLLETVQTKGDETQTTRYRYDSNGNQLGKQTDITAPVSAEATPSAGFQKDVDAVELMGYNGFNQMVSAYSGGKQAQYYYRPDGMRHSKAVDGVAAIHLWDGQNIVADVDGAGAVASTYLRGINLLAAKGAESNHKFYLYNAHGDVVQLADDSGAILWQYDYDAFGVQKAIEGQDASTDTNPFRYCGEYFDRETDTVYLRARYYDPVIGRFMAEDSVTGITRKLPNGQEVTDPLSLNRYTYAHNSPIRFRDPSGYSAMDILYGLVMSLDNNMLGGASQGLGRYLFGDRIRIHDSDYDYYLGSLIGDAVSTVVSATEIAAGIVTTIGSVGGGGAATVLSGGLLTVGGVAVAAGGVAAGTAMTTHGSISFAKSSGNFSSNFKKMKSADSSSLNMFKNNKEADKVAQKLGFKGAEDLKKYFVKKSGSQYNMKYNKKTKEIFLEAIKDSSKRVATGLYK